LADQSIGILVGSSLPGSERICKEKIDQQLLRNHLLCLSAYAFALEHPAPNALSIFPITRLGLFIITPDRFERLSDGEVAFVNKTTWMNVPRDDATFMNLLTEIVKLLDQPIPPPPAGDCGLCNYRKNYNQAGILE